MYPRSLIAAAAAAAFILGGGFVQGSHMLAPGEKIDIDAGADGNVAAPKYNDNNIVADKVASQLAAEEASPTYRSHRQVAQLAQLGRMEDWLAGQDEASTQRAQPAEDSWVRASRPERRGPAPKEGGELEPREATRWLSKPDDMTDAEWSKARKDMERIAREVEWEMGRDESMWITHVMYENVHEWIKWPAAAINDWYMSYRERNGDFYDDQDGFDDYRKRDHVEPEQQAELEQTESKLEKRWICCCCQKSTNTVVCKKRYSWECWCDPKCPPAPTSSVKGYGY